MISFVKFVAVFLAASIATAALAAKNDGDATPKPDAKEAGGKKSKDGSDAKTDDDTPPRKMDVPVPKGHDAKGLTIPYFDNTGKLEMKFVIAVASRIDDNHLRFTDLQIETFNEQGEHEMAIDLPTSIFDTDTSVITTDKHVKITRSDFELTGETMIFNTKTKLGGLGGRVRMLIYNLADETGDNRTGDTPGTDEPKANTSESTAATPAPAANTPAPVENTPKPSANTPKSKAK